MSKFVLSKQQFINLLIVFIWIAFFLLNWITYTRFMYFLTILEFILIYRILINKLEYSKSLKISDSKILNLIFYLNKYRNPILLLLIKLDVLTYDVIIYYNNKILNFIIYLLYLLIINPLKILFFKYYIILWIWKTNKIWNILFNRMFGLILSVLIFTNVIGYMINTLHLDIFVILYIYLLVISILCEIIEVRDNKLLKILLVLHINTLSILSNRKNVNLLSVFLRKNGKDEISCYIDFNQRLKIEKFKIGYTYYIIDSLKQFQHKPNYWCYFDLRSLVEQCYLMPRIDEYIFFQYYEWNVPCIYLLVGINTSDINKLRQIYEYDYKVFKTLLFLYWDLEYHLGNFDYVINSLKVDSTYSAFLRIKFNNTFRSEIEFFEKIKYKDSNNFLINFEVIYNLLLKYNLFNKIDDLLNYKYDNNFSTYKLYKNYNDLLIHSDISLLRELQAVKDPIDPLYYENYIEEWYKEWMLEINQDLSFKYDKKINILDMELNNLSEALQKQG